MGIKVIILQACLIAGEDIGKHAAVGERVEITKDDALYLARAGRALYLNKEDDPTKGLLTATDADLRAVKQHAAAIEQAAAVTAEQPQDMGSIIAAAVQQGIAAGIAAAQQQSKAAA